MTVRRSAIAALAIGLVVSGCGSEPASNGAAGKTESSEPAPAKSGTQTAASETRTKVPPAGDECTKDVETAAAAMKVTNSTTAPVDLYWWGFDCEPVHYVTIKPGGTSTQNTFVDHRWAATSGSSEPVASHVVAGGTDTWNITAPS